MKKTFVFGFFSVLILLILSLTEYERPDETMSTSTHLDYVRESMRGGPIEPNVYFLLPDRCAGCHGYDSLKIANIDIDSNDINLVDDWSTSMMALAGKDPLWLAKVRHESLVNPAHAAALQNTCTSCHAPMGHYQAYFSGHLPYTLTNLNTDSLGRAGVACMACHSIGTDRLGSRFSGDIPYDTNRVAYGPFVTPMAGPMQLYVGLTPTYATHVSESRVCSPCHTLITNTVDLSGVPTGGTFVEQATYHEWLNSEFPGKDKPCQSCHMPQVEEPVKIAVGYTSLSGRSPFNKHVFAGANFFMLNLMKQHKDSLDISAKDADFEQTLSATTNMLRNNTLDLHVIFKKIENDSAFIDVLLKNKAGHKFPSGYPSRRAILQFMVIKSNGDTLFASGKLRNDGELLHPNLPFEKHHDVINNESQNQIYEFVMGDVAGNKTTVLERGASTLKDNRLVPKGFNTSFSSYDTCRIDAVALADTDFNKIAGSEGSGTDIVHFHIPLHGYYGAVNIYSQMYYTAVPPSWLTEMFTFSAPEIDRWKNMYNTADKTAQLVAADSLLNLSIPNAINEIFESSVQLYPNPSIDGHFTVDNIPKECTEIKVFDINGNVIRLISCKGINADRFQIDLNSQPGIYFIQFNCGIKQLTKKVVITAK